MMKYTRQNLGVLSLTLTLLLQPIRVGAAPILTPLHVQLLNEEDPMTMGAPFTWEAHVDEHSGAVRGLYTEIADEILAIRPADDSSQKLLATPYPADASNSHAAALSALVVSDDTIRLMSRIVKRVEISLVGAGASSGKVITEVKRGLDRLDAISAAPLKIQVAGTAMADGPVASIYYDASSRSLNLRPFYNADGALIEPGLNSHMVAMLAGHAALDEVMGGLWGRQLQTPAVHVATAQWMSMMWALWANPENLAKIVHECGGNLFESTSLMGRMQPLLNGSRSVNTQEPWNIRVKYPGFLSSKRHPLPSTALAPQEASRVLTGILFEIAAESYARHQEAHVDIPLREHLKAAMMEVSELLIGGLFRSRTSKREIHLSNLHFHMHRHI